MPFYSGVYYSHYASLPVANANTRILCGKNTQAQNWAPAILSVTDYGALSTGTTYYFRFPLIVFPAGTNVPLTYKVRLLHYSNDVPYPTVISQFKYQAKNKCTGAAYNYNYWADLLLTTNVVQNTMSMSFRYRSVNFGTGSQTIVKFKNNFIPALTSLNTLTTLTASGYTYQYYPNINLCSFVRTSSATNSFTLGTYPTSVDQQDFSITFVQTFGGTTRWNGWFNSGSATATYTVNAATSWTSSSFVKGSNLMGTNSWDKYTISWSANYLSFPEGSYMLITINNYLDLIDEHCYSHSGFIQGVNDNSNLVCKRYSSNQILVAGYSTLAASASLSITVYMALQNGLTIDGTYTTDATIKVVSSEGHNIIQDHTNSITLAMANIRGSNSIGLSGTMNIPYSAGSAFPLFITFQLRSHTLLNGDYLEIDFGDWILDTADTGVRVFKYQIAGNKYWVPSAATHVSDNIFKVPVYSHYSMTAGTQITLWVDIHAPTAYYGAKATKDQWNTFKIYAYDGTTLVEQ